MPTQEDRDARLQASKELTRKALGETHHVLAQSITDLGDTVDTIKFKVETITGKVDTLNTGVSKLYEVIAGDPKFEAKGLISKGKELEGRMDRMEERLDKRLANLEGIYKWACGALAAIGLFGGLLVEYIKSLFGKH